MSFIANAFKKTNAAAIGATMASLHGDFGTATKDLTDMFAAGQLGGLMQGAQLGGKQLGTIPTWGGTSQLPVFTKTITNTGAGRGQSEGDNTLHLNPPGPFSPGGPLDHPISGPVWMPPGETPVGPMHPIQQPGKPIGTKYNPFAALNKFDSRFAARRKMVGGSLLAPVSR